ncbi:MAG TPA: hypothetical protein VM093_07240 [Aeromicrobium sp.]|nr:hypothetical protein [Aeromicrobium sp.]
MGTSRWWHAIDSYCERTDASYWSEPLNAISNIAFVVAAVVIWRTAHAARDRAGQALAMGAAGIGIGSFLFHTFATVWALQADIQPIRLFVLAFIGLGVVRFFAARWWVGLVASVAFVPAGSVVAAAARAGLGPLNGSVGYLPMLVLLLGAAAAVWRRSPSAGRGLLLASGIFAAALVFRTVDLALCQAWPLGTHFLWHALNGVVVGLLGVIFVRAGRHVATVTG